MDKSLAEIFRLHSDINGFFQEVLQLDGLFSLNRDDMEALGQAYFEKYPEKFVRRNLEEVRLGYRITRFCLLEKALAGMTAETKEFFRKAFERPETIAGQMKESVAPEVLPELVSGFERLQAALNELKAAVDELPRGMIKERFLGGLSTLFNVSYLLNILLAKSGQNSLQE